MGFINIPYYSEFAALILLGISAPALHLLRQSKNEVFSVVKLKSIYIILAIGLLTFLLSKLLPFYEMPALMVLFVVPWIFIVFYFIKYFHLLFNSSVKEYNYGLSKLLLPYISFFGLLLILFVQPLLLNKEARLYEKDFLLRPAYELGYALPYAEAENLIRVKGLIDELDSLPEYKNKWEKKEEKQYFKLKMEIYTPPKPAEESIEQLNESGRSRRSRILKLRERFEEEKKKTDTEKKE